MQRMVGQPDYRCISKPEFIRQRTERRSLRAENEKEGRNPPEVYPPKGSTTPVSANEYNKNHQRQSERIKNAPDVAGAPVDVTLTPKRIRRKNCKM